jgi:hypothetical protein
MKLTPFLTAAALIAGLLVTATTTSAFGGALTHDLLYAVTVRNDLLSFYSDQPGTILHAHAITGLAGAESIRGIDFDPTRGSLYGLGSSSGLYVIHPATGAATLVRQFGNAAHPGFLLDGQVFGFDAKSDGVRIVSELDQNLLLNRLTGAGVNDTPAAQVPLSALAYEPTNLTMYAIKHTTSQFGTFNPGTGTFTPIGSLGIGGSRQNGMDLSQPSGQIYFASPAVSTDPAANLYTINPNTGGVTLVGLIGNPGDNILVHGLAVAVLASSTTAPAPTLSRWAMLLLGALLSAFGAWKSCARARAVGVGR